MSDGGEKLSNGTTVAALVGFCVVAILAMSSAALGALLVLGAGGLAVGVMVGRVLRDRRYAAVTASIAAMALLGASAGISKRARKADEQGRQPVATVERARVVADRTASLIAAAPELLTRTRADLAHARELIGHDRFGEANRVAEAAKEAIAETAALILSVDDARALADQLDLVSSNSASLGSVRVLLLDARELKSSRPTDQDAVAWDARLEMLALALRRAPFVAVGRYAAQLTVEADAIDRQRARFRRQVLRAKHRENLRLGRAMWCGDAAPLVDELDGALVGAEHFVALGSQYPDSIDVTNCTPPRLAGGACWISVCDVREKNASGALVSSRYRFSVGRTGILEASPTR